MTSNSNFPDDELEGGLEGADAGDATIEWSTEEAELDRLYRQALDVVDEIEREMQLPWQDSAADEKDDQEISIPAVESSSEISSSSNSVSISQFPESSDFSSQPRIMPGQVLEAALFVGGKPLTTKSLIHLLRDEFTAASLEEMLDRLNQQYLRENRPYEIRLGEGGWHLQLRQEFEKVRHRVYGLGPREVKLSQDALEVLSLVAYHQPISVEGMTDLGKPSPGATLRQLLRRELIAIERGEGGRHDVKYRTTQRFLQLFDLSDLEELPQAEEIRFK